MKKKTLYLICPECHIEQSIRHRFGSGSYFLTALGTVFDMSEYAEEVNQFVSDQEISEIIIVNDTQCTFISNTFVKDNNHKTRAERELERLLKNNNLEFKSLGLMDRKIKLAKLNIYRQAYELSHLAFIGNKIRDGIIDISGLIYNREDSTFEKLKLELCITSAP